MSYGLTLTIRITGDEYPVMEAAGMIDEALESMGDVVATHADGSPSRISGRIEGAGPVAISTTVEEVRA